MLQVLGETPLSPLLGQMIRIEGTCRWGASGQALEHQDRGGGRQGQEGL